MINTFNLPMEGEWCVLNEYNRVGWDLFSIVLLVSAEFREDSPSSILEACECSLTKFLLGTGPLHWRQ